MGYIRRGLGFICAHTSLGPEETMNYFLIFSLAFVLAVFLETVTGGILGAALLGVGAFKGYLAARHYGGYYGGYYPGYYGNYYGGYYPYYRGSYYHGHWRKRRAIAEKNTPNGQIFEDIARLDGESRCVLKLICEVRSKYDRKILKLKTDIDEMIREIASQAHPSIAAQSFQEADNRGRFHPTDCAATYNKCHYSYKEMISIFHEDVEIPSTPEPELTTQ